MFYLIMLTILIIDRCNCEAATEYLAKCEATEDCAWLGENSDCIYKECRCQEGFRWYRGKCQKYSGLGGDCTEDPGCYDGYNPLALVCSPEQKCTCNDGYYLRDGIDCRKQSDLILNNACAIDNDCVLGKCIKGKCSIGECIEGECSIGKCIKQKCSNMSNLEENLDYENIDYYSNTNVKIYESCQNETDCPDKNTMECYDKKCVCKKGYFLSEEKCIREIGMNTGDECTNATDCGMTGTQCLNGVCYCRDLYFTAEGNRKCVKSMQQTNWNCLSREWCFALGPNSFCTSNDTCSCSANAEFDEDSYACKKTGEGPSDLCISDSQCDFNKKYSSCIDEHCNCKEGYREEDNKCYPDLGQFCDEAAEEPECIVENANCTNSVCNCSPHFIANKDQDKCYEVVDEIGGSCEENVQCSSMLYTNCTNGACLCDQDHLSYENRCIARKEHNSYCNNLLECTVSLGETFVCRKGKCQCATGVKYNKELNECGSGAGAFPAAGYATLATLLLLLICI